MNDLPVRRLLRAVLIVTSVAVVGGSLAGTASAGPEDWVPEFSSIGTCDEGREYPDGNDYGVEDGDNYDCGQGPHPAAGEGSSMFSGLLP